VELSNYYNHNNTPDKEFGRYFFYDWDKEEWNRFYSFMISCIQLYLQIGLVKYTSTSFTDKKIKTETCPEFVEFAVDNIIIGERLFKNDLFDRFTILYPDFAKKLTQRRFFIWVDLWAEYMNCEVEKDRFNGVRYVLLTPKNK
jgi:hypothetical protein